MRRSDAGYGRHCKTLRLVEAQPGHHPDAVVRFRWLAAALVFVIEFLS